MSGKRRTLPALAGPLQTILDAELARGNRILDVSAWPPKCRTLVLLTRPFARKYALVPGLEFHNTDDPHYWKAEYMYPVGLEQSDCLACAF